MDNLLHKYRPATLSEVLGQPDVVEALKQFAAAPYPAGLLFHGESGTGKTSAAVALARDLGVDVDQQELGGLHEIASGEMTAEAVRERLNGLRFRTLFGSGWKVLVCNEADRMSPAAEVIWLDGLEHLPPQSVVVFTTNDPSRLSKRLRDRLDNYYFECEPEKLKPAIDALARKVWKAEVGKGKVPCLEGLGLPTLGADLYVHASFRLALHQLARYVREAKLGKGDMAKVKRQQTKDLLVTEDLPWVACDHCGAEQQVRAGTAKIKCAKCGRTSKVEWE